MKKLLLALLCTGAVVAQTPTEVALKIGYVPQKVYTILQNNTNTATITFSGPDEVIEALKEQGIENPTIEKETNENVLEITTGKLNPKGDFPLEMRVISTDNERFGVVLGPNAVIYGHATTNNFPVLDSLSGVEQQYEQALLQSMRAVLSQIKYPEQKIKVGQSASINTPMSIPMGGIVLTMDINSTYTLKSINGHMADYDMDIVCTLNGNFGKRNVVGGGSGKGVMTYDTSNNYYKSYNMDISMQASIENEGVTINFKIDQNVSGEAEIKKK